MDDDDDDDDDGVFLTTASYTKKDLRKRYKDMNWIITAQNIVRWWAFVISDEPAVRISYITEL